MRGLSVGGFCFGEQTLPRIGLAINNNLLKYYKKFLSNKKLVRIFIIKSISYKIQNFS